MPVSSSMASGSKVGGGGGSKADILLAISLIAKGLNEAEKVRKELQNLNKETKSSGQSSGDAAKMTDQFGNALKFLSGTATAVVGTVAALAKALDTVLAVGKEGAAYRQMNESFQTLNEVVAPNIDLLQQLGDASLGTTSKFELMNAASVALAGLTGEFGEQMAGALPQLLKIAKASEKMNPALGDTAFLFQSLTIGLKRLSPRLIDNTGLQIRLSEAYDKLAKERGKAANELTAEEQQLALLNATLEAGDILINQAGNSVASYTDVYSQLGANVENTKNSFKAWFDLVIGSKVATSLNLIFFGQQMVNDELERFNKESSLSSGSYEEYIKKVTNAAVAAGKLSEAQRDIIIATQVEGMPMNEALFEYLGVSKDARYEAEEYQKDLINVMDALGLLNKEQFDYNNVIEDNTKAQEEYGTAMLSGRDAAEAWLESQQKAQKSTLGLQEALKLAKTDEEKVRIATELFSVALDANSIATYENERATLVNKLAIEELTDEERKAIEAQIEGIEAKLSAAEASQKLAEEEMKLAEETKKTADEARNAKTAFQTMFEGLNRNLPSAIGDTLGDIEFLLAGGRELQAQYELVEQAMLRGLVPPDAAQNVLEMLYVKAQALGVELGDTSKYDAIVATMNTLDITYDKVRASQQADVLYQEKINELIKDGVDITDERREKEYAIAQQQAVINEKYSEAQKILENISEYDFFGDLAKSIDPETFIAAFSQLPDELQGLFTEVFSNLAPQELDVQVKPTLPEGAPQYLEDIGAEIYTEATVDVGVEGEEKDLIDWFFDGATKEQTATVLASFSPELPPEMAKLLGEDSVDQSINVAVSDDIQNDLSKLILNDVIETTIKVTVITEGEVPGKATGGRVLRGQPTVVGEVRPEIFVPDTSGRVLQTTSQNPYETMGSSNGSTSISVSINNPVISNDLDLEILAYQLARKISERQKGMM